MSEDYEVGYGKPPRANRFKRGQSGNPNGRPKANTNLRVFLTQMMDEDVPVQGKDSTVTKRDAMVRTLVDNAMNGNQRAFRRFLQLANRARLFEKTKEQTIVHTEYADVDRDCKRLEDERERIRAAREALLARHKSA